MLIVFRLLKKSQWLPFDWDIQAGVIKFFSMVQKHYLEIMIIRLYSSVAIGVVIVHLLFSGPYLIKTIIY